MTASALSNRFVFRALAGWFVLTLAAFIVMLFYTSDSPVILGHYSLTYAVQLALMGVALVITGGLTGLAYREKLPAIPAWIARPAVRNGLLIAGCAGLIGFWAFMPGTRFHPQIMLFLVYGLVSLFFVWLILLRASGADGIELPDGAPVAAVTLMLAAAIGLRLVYPTAVPQTIQFDEAWIANWGYSMYTTGQPVVTMMPAQPPEKTVLLSAVLPVEGFWLAQTGISLAAARLFWLLMCWLSAPFIYLTARLLYGNFAALTALLLALCIPLFHSYVRPDNFVALPLSIGIYFLVSARSFVRLALRAGRRGTGAHGRRPCPGCALSDCVRPGHGG